MGLFQKLDNEQIKIKKYQKTKADLLLLILSLFPRQYPHRILKSRINKYHPAFIHQKILEHDLPPLQKHIKYRENPQQNSNLIVSHPSPKKQYYNNNKEHDLKNLNRLTQTCSEYARKHQQNTIKSQFKHKIGSSPYQNTSDILKTCQFLRYFVRISEFHLISEGISEELHTCMKLVKMLMKVSDYEAHGHRFSVISKLLKKYQQFHPTAIVINKNLVYSKLSAHQNSTYYRSLHRHPISSSELSFSHSQNINPFFNSLLNNELILHNNSCLCCTQIFMTNMRLYNNNPKFKVIEVVETTKIGELALIKRCINGVCNLGGGMLIIGVERKSEVLCATGIKYTNQEQLTQIQKQIVTSIKSTRPDCSYQIDRVPVHPPYTNISNTTLYEPRVCFKILLSPASANKINYIKFSAKGYQNLYEIYSLQSNEGGLEKIEFGENLYNIIYQRYRQKIKVRDSHKNIKCLRPVPYQLFNLDDKTRSKSINFSQKPQKAQNVKKNQQISSLSLEQNDIKFPYPYTSLLAVNSKKEDRHIQNFFKILQTKKQKVELIKPFANSFPNCSRSFWMLSHENKSEQIKQHLIAAYSSNSLPDNSITLMPVYRILQINRQKLSEYNQQQLHKKYKLKYPTQPYKTQSTIILDKKMNQKTILYLIFSTPSHAIYAYLIFQQLNLRPIFIRCIIPMKNKNKLNSIGMKEVKLGQQ